MVKDYLCKAAIVFFVCFFVFSLSNIAYGVEFNDDIQKITLDYDYFDRNIDYFKQTKGPSSWAADSVNFVLENNFMQGVGNGMFSPKSNIQTYIIMYRILNWIRCITEKDEIYNPITTELEVMEVNLPVVKNDEFRNAFTVAGEYIYYEGEGGIIYQTPVYDLGIKKAVYELPLYTHGDSFVYPGLDTVQGKAMLYYHQGGAAMGNDYIIMLNDDGTNEIFSAGYRYRKNFDGITVDVSYAVPPHPNNLSVQTDKEEYKVIGIPDYMYGWLRMDSIGSIPSMDMYKIDDEIYILANKYDADDAIGIYRININTNETVRICDESAQRFTIEENIIYFMDLGGYLYKIPIGGSKAEKLADFTVSNFAVLNGVVYYVAQYDKGLELFKLGQSASVNPGGIVRKLVRTDGYIYCLFENNSPYKLMVFNKDGMEVFKTNADIRFAYIDKNRLFYYNYH